MQERRWHSISVFVFATYKQWHRDLTMNGCIGCHISNLG